MTRSFIYIGVVILSTCSKSRLRHHVAINILLARYFLSFYSLNIILTANIISIFFSFYPGPTTIVDVVSGALQYIRQGRVGQVLNIPFQRYSHSKTSRLPHVRDGLPVIEERWSRNNLVKGDPSRSHEPTKEGWCSCRRHH